MIRINQIKIKAKEGDSLLKAKVQKIVGKNVTIHDIKIVKKSIDARKKPELYFVYSVDVSCDMEDKIVKFSKGKIVKVNQKKYSLPKEGEKFLSHRPIVVGSGPCGMFASLMLARKGYNPIVLERGKKVEERIKDTENFFKTGVLDENSNVQFGEGGAGTFSDGKLNTGVKDKTGRNRLVLETFVEFGASEKILYEAKPHIGTDVLSVIMKNMREEIIRLGGEFLFSSMLTDVLTNENAVTGVVVTDVINNSEKYIPTETILLAIGHSARDTFNVLNKKNVNMEAKAFAVGLRAEHPQKMINESQYGKDSSYMDAASYKLAHTTKDKTGVYSFCMCPGGYVVNSSSEKGMLVVNGMSYSKRDGENANSAIVVTVSPKDYGNESVLSGVEFQRDLERKAFNLGSGKIPVERFEDFKNKNKNPKEKKENLVRPNILGEYVYKDLREILPDFISEKIVEGINVFGKKIKGFDNGDVILSGVESRTSSPVRILRDEFFESNIKGLMPAGEGAGYAGGITSAAIDGIKTAEAIIKKYRPLS